MSKSTFATLLLACCIGNTGFGQQPDTLSLSLPEVENIFLQKNLLLLAQRYQVSASKAAEIQAGLYNNPTFSTELALKAKNSPWFDWGSNGQKAFNLDQIIILARKRNKRVQLAKEETKQAEFALYDLMRTLKYELRSNYYSIAYSRKLLQQLDKQRDLLTKIVNAYAEQSVKRNISAKDLVRLKTELIQLNSSRNDIITKSIASQQALQLLLDTTAAIAPNIVVDTLHAGVNLQANFLETALTNRADMHMQESMYQQSLAYQKYQKALGTPDMSVGAGYDQNGSYQPQYFAIHAAIDLPVFNRNQGAIKQAEEQIKIQQTALTFKQNSIQNEIAGSLARIHQLESEYQSNQENFAKDYPDINRGIIENFNKGNINIIEFLDFFESYNVALQVINDIQKQRTLAYEELEYVTGAPLNKQ